MGDSHVFNTVLADLFHEQINRDDFNVQTEYAAQKKARNEVDYYSVSFVIPKVDPLAVLEQFSDKTGFEYYWELPKLDFAIAASGNLARVQASGPNRFKEASTRGKSILNKIYHFSALNHSLAVVHLLGGFSFFDDNSGDIWKDFGSGSFTLPEWLIIKDGFFHILTVTIKLEADDTALCIKDRFFNSIYKLRNITKADQYLISEDMDMANHFNVPAIDSPEYLQWIHSVEGAKEQIANNYYNKIVLARELVIKLEHKVTDTKVLHRLRNQYPDCYSFLIRQNEKSSFIGCTPERLASFKGDYLYTEGLAGSSPRGKSATEDAKLEMDLLSSLKNLDEHNFVLRAIEGNLEPFAENLELQPKPGIKKLNNVFHLHTPIKAKIKKEVSKTEVLKTLHPTPAVGGFPKKDAIPHITTFENFERGWYAAPIGWINANGEGEFAVAIRSGLIKKDEVRFYAGCGIVGASDPVKEWEETNVKFIPMLSALDYASK